MKIKRNPDSIHAPFSSYSHQVELKREHRLLMVSGQVGADVRGKIVDGIEEQLDLAWKNLGENLSAANMTYDDVVKLTVYLVENCIETDSRRDLFAKVFSSVAPCMTMIYVPALGDPAMLIELDAWASAE